MAYPKHLLAHLEENPEIREVHFNSEGEWVFHPRKTHLDTKSRTAVLGFSREGAGIAPAVVTEGVTVPPTAAKKK
jgi:formamidopyrimidine-DNA glycosylase